MARRRDDVCARATDWVVATAPDLQGKRPRDETKRLVARVIDVNVAIFERGDRAPLHEFVEYVTSYRATSEFRVSTVLRGFLSFKQGLLQIMREERTQARDKLAVLAVLDDIYYEAIFHISDVYGEKLVHTIKQRRDEIEVELGEKRSELEATFDVAERLRMELISISLPILPVWKGVLLVPLIGEISPGRAQHVRVALLDAIVRNRARVVLLDVTGLGLVDSFAAGVLGSVVKASSLVGCEAIIVGIRGIVAQMFIQIGEVFPGTRTFATLDEGLRQALRAARTV